MKSSQWLEEQQELLKKIILEHPELNPLFFETALIGSTGYKLPQP